MLPFDDVLKFDRMALDALVADVASIDAAQWTLPTPCDGWTVLDLVEHMTTEHIAICGGDRPDGDTQHVFATVAERWLAFFEDRAGAPVTVPGLGLEQPSEVVLAIHFADMVVHRWDLGAARGYAPSFSEDILRAAHAVAATATHPESPLVGEGRAYRPALPANGRDSLVLALLRRYGRDPEWLERRPGVER